MKVRAFSAIAAVLVLAGCANTREYTLYAQGQASIEQARYAAEAERFKAMAAIASSGDSTAKVAAMFALAMGGGAGGSQNGSTQLKAPEAPGQTALQWASILIPSLTQGYSIYANTKLGMTNSNNNARIAESTNNSFVGISNNIASTGAAAANSAYQIVQSSNQAVLGVAAQIQAPQANVTTNTTNTTTTTSNATSTTTLSGAGVIGNGTYSTQNNPTLSGTGTQGGGSYSPSTTTTTPAPVVTPVITVPPVVVTPVVVVPPAPAASGSGS